MASSRNGKWMLLGGAAAAGAAFFLDSENGPQRRATAIKQARKFGQKVDWAVRDTEHKIVGNIKHLLAALSRGPVDDRVLEERIRSRMGRLVTRPQKIHIACEAGVVTLWGQAPDPDVARLLEVVTGMGGVREVRDHIEDEALSAAIEQTSAIRKAHRDTLLHWSPARRLVTGAIGTAAAIYGLKRKDRFGFALAAIGAGVAAHSMLEKNVPSLLALSEECPGFEVSRTIRVNAPISTLYDFWTRPENYPKVFSHISEIARLGENLYRWTINGPAGIPIHWEGMITRSVPNTLVEWKSLPGSMVGNFGAVRFDPNYDASTRVNIRMFYRPPAGILGRFLAELVGTAPEKVLDQDLDRMKMLFENDQNLVAELKEGGDEQLLKIAKT